MVVRLDGRHAALEGQDELLFLHEQHVGFRGEDHVVRKVHTGDSTRAIQALGSAARNAQPIRMSKVNMPESEELDLSRI